VVEFECEIEWRGVQTERLSPSQPVERHRIHQRAIAVEDESVEPAGREDEFKSTG
jgi:hypothetical protein